MKRCPAIFLLVSAVTLGTALCLGQPRGEGEDKEVQQLIRRAEGYFVIGEDEEGFKTLDAGIEEYRGQPEAGEFLYAKAMEFCKYYREDAEKKEGRKLLKEYVEQFPDGRHMAQAVGEIGGDLSAGEKRKYYRMIIERKGEATYGSWAMEGLAELISKSKPQEALSLRKRIMEEHPRSGQAYNALVSLAKDDLKASRPKEAAEKLRKCLFDFTELPCQAFGEEDGWLAKMAEKTPAVAPPEGKPLPEYTPYWTEGECWETDVAVAPLGPGDKEAARWRGYFFELARPRNIFAYVGPAEQREGRLCSAIHREGVPYAYSPEIVLYLGKDDSNFVDAKRGEGPFDPFYSRSSGEQHPFFLPRFPLRLGKTAFRAGRHRIVQDCSIKEGKAEVRLHHCGQEVVMLFSKNPVWWDELRYLTRYYPPSAGPGVWVPMICRVIRTNRSDPSLDLNTERSAHSLMGKIEKAMHDNKMDEMNAAGQELLAKFPKHRFCPMYLRMLSQRGGTPNSRDAAADRILREYPTSPEAMEARRWLVQRLEGEERILALRELIQSESDPGAAMEARRQLLYALQGAEDYQGVVDEYMKLQAEASKWDVKDHRIRDHRIRQALTDAVWPAAQAYYRLGDYEKAVEFFGKYEESLPLYARSGNIVKACALVKLGRFKQALEACEGNESRSADIVRAFAQYGMGREKDAVAALERAAFDRLDPQAMTYLALLHEGMGNNGEAGKMFAYLLDKFPDEKVFTDFVLRLYTSDKPSTTGREFCLRRLGSESLPPAEEISWKLVPKHSTRQSVYAENLYPWDIDGDGYIEFVITRTYGLQALRHDLTPLWTLGGSSAISYADFRRKDERKLMFACGPAKYLLARSVWIDGGGRIVAEAEYSGDLGRRALAKKSDALEFNYGRSGDNEVIATRRKVFLRDREGKDLWSYALAGIPEKKGSERALWPATPAVQDVLAVDLDGDAKDEFLVIVEKRDVGLGMTYYLMPAGGKIMLLGNDGKPTWQHDTGIIKRVSFRDCTGDGKMEIIVEDDGVKIISPEGKLLCEANPNGYDLGDYDEDGGLELFLCSSDGITVQKLDGTPLLKVDFAEGRDVAWGDLTGDGIPEIVAVTTNHVLVMDRTGKLVSSHDLGDKRMQGVLVLDADNDGRNDILAFGQDIDIYNLIPARGVTVSPNGKSRVMGVSPTSGR